MDQRKALFGWTVVLARVQHRTRRAFHVYERDCPADAAHWSADLTPFTYATRALAVAAGKRGDYAYKRDAAAGAQGGLT